MKNVLLSLTGLPYKKLVDVALKLGLKKSDVKTIEVERGGIGSDMHMVKINILDLWMKNTVKPTPSWEELRGAVWVVLGSTD